MKSYNNLYPKIISLENLILAWRKARKSKTKKDYVIKFEKELFCNLMALHYELKFGTYFSKPLETFILRDPKTRKISKADFRDRVIHHALLNPVRPVFEIVFFYDSCSNQINKGTSFALKKFEKFRRKVTRNYTIGAFCLKTDIKHYFQEVDHKILLEIIKKKITDENIIWLVKQILKANFSPIERERERVMLEKACH